MPIVVSGQASGSYSLTAGQVLDVTSGGSVSNTMVGSGGIEIVSSGGAASFTVVSNGGTIVLDGGIATDTVLDQGANVAVGVTSRFAGSGYSPGVNLVVLQGSGRVASAAVGSGGAIEDYGFVSAAIVGSGGAENVFGDGGYAIFTAVQSGGTESVYSRGRAYGTVVSNGGTEIILTHGSAAATTIAGGGRQYVYSSGAANSATIRNGGVQTVHGSALATVVQGGGAANVFSGGIATSIAIASGGNEFVYSAGIANSTLVASGGSETVYASGTASGSTVSSGGVQYVYSSGTAVSTMIDSGGTVFIHSMGVAAEATIYEGGRIDLPFLGYAGSGSAVLGAGNVLTVTEGTNSATLALAGNYTENFFTLSQDSGTGTIITAESVACYCRGTRILTDTGEVAIEDLAIGDRLATVSGEIGVIRWIGHRQVDCRRHPAPASVHPVRLRAGCLADGQPRRDLFLSPDHAVLIDGVLIPVKSLVNNATIRQEPHDEVSYFHIELERHNVILAEGVPCETYLDTGNRSAFANGGGAVQLHPDFSAAQRCEAIWHAAGYAPLRIHGEEVERIATLLRQRAAMLGYRVGSKSPARHRAAATTSDLADLLQPQWYLRTNPDVAASGLDAATHYAGWGRSEGRLPCPEIDLLRGLGLVDPLTVAITMADVVDAGMDPVAHFLATGWREGRRPNRYFNTGWYIKTYDIPSATNPLLHYILCGENQGFAPSRHFDPVRYRQDHALAPSVSALAHYLHHGRATAAA